MKGSIYKQYYYPATTVSLQVVTKPRKKITTGDDDDDEPMTAPTSPIVDTNAIDGNKETHHQTKRTTKQ